MNILLIIALGLVFCLLALLLYLLLAPFKIVLDTNQRIMFCGWHPRLSARIIETNQQWLIRVNTPMWVKQWPVEDILFRDKRKKKSKSKSRKPGFRPSWSRIVKVIHQLKIKEFKLILDTDNYILNAYLVPVFELIRYKTGLSTRINYNGYNEMKLRVESRVINVLKAAIF